MASITKRRDGEGKLRYRAQVRVKGKHSLSKTFTKLREARDWALHTEADLRRGLVFPATEAKLHTVSAAIQRYRREAMLLLKANTRQSLHYLLRWWERELDAYTLADVTPALMTRGRQKLLDAGRANGSANRYMAALSAVFTIAVREWQWTQDNPCHKIARLREPCGRVRYLTHKERTRLIAECKASKSPALYPVVLIALSTGARRGELLNLRWRDVNLTTGLLTFRDTKTGDNRAVPVQGMALDVLRAWGEVRIHGDDTLVFPSANGRRPASLREAFEQALRRAAIDDFRWHDMRHDTASRLVMAGATLRDVQELLGHKTTSMTLRYSHLSPDYLRGVATKAAL